MYRALVRIERGFAQVVEALEDLRQNKSCRGPAMNAAVLAVYETRAGMLFEVLEALHAHEEREWTRLGRKRMREERRAQLGATERGS